MKWAGHVACLGERRVAYRVLVGKPEGRRPKRRWEYNIKMDIQDVRWGGGTDWIDLAYNRDVVGCCNCGNELLGSIKCGEFLV
jgi:hypothetical protein